LNEVSDAIQGFKEDTIGWFYELVYNNKYLCFLNGGILDF